MTSPTPPPVYATPADVADRLGGVALGEAEDRKVARFLRTAHTRLRRLDQTLDTRVASGVLEAQAVGDVLVEAVWRAVEDERIGWRVRSEGWPESTTEFDTSPAERGVFFTADELADIGIDGTTDGTSGAFTINGWRGRGHQ
ncbi:MAG: hypothetical protein LKG15_07810 [Corynebacterium provencense]|jgi:hypothetical protein|uniref:hypothetical protein n=1 Tax=Corynebacterium provencense TaxID=1737425 RepID=UPI002989DA3A|nr:hypothetical protein [Corynebacterium provencense]